MSTYRLNVYEAINQVSLAMSRDGITKGRKNEQQGYAFRGIDDMYNALSIPLASVGLCIIPRFKNRTVTERVTAKGGTLFYVTIEGEFDLVGPDGSKHTALTFGEAMDSGDKATNKAMSAAFKYMSMQLFCVPTEGDNDADATTHELQARADAVAQRRIAELQNIGKYSTSAQMNPDPLPSLPPETIIELAEQLNGPPAEPPILAPEVKKPVARAKKVATNFMSFAALKKYGEVKAQLKAVRNDNDKFYYEKLAPYKHANEIPSKEESARIWPLLQIGLVPDGPSAAPKQDTALLLELSVYKQRFGTDEFHRILGLNGFESIEDFMVNANGLQADTLLWDLKDRSRPQ